MLIAQAAVRQRGLRSKQEAELRAGIAIPKSPLEYAERYRKIDNQPFTLERHAPLRALYTDQSQNIAVMKPSQRGVSEWAITYALWILDVGAQAMELPKAGLNVGYIFPTKEALGDFSKERVAGMKAEHEHLRMILGSSPFDGIGFRQIGQSFWYLRGGNSEAGLLSFPADMIVRDEYDKIPPVSRELVTKRMNASEFRRMIDISTPTLPGIGIHERYLQSDQHVYLQECPNCHAENQYDFFRDVTVDGVRYDQWRQWQAQQIRRGDVALTCPRCTVELDRAARCVQGRYEPKFPDVAGLRGYHVPALAFPFVNLMELAVTAVNPDPTVVEQFMRQDIGVPFHSEGSGITQEMLVPLSLDLPNGQLPPGPYMRRCAGIDVGQRIHIRINGEKPGEPKPYVLWMGSVTTWAEVDDLMERFHIQMAVVDSMPDIHAAADFVARHKGRAVLADYPTQMNALKGMLFTPETKKAVQDGFVRVNRTMALDRVFTAISAQREHWPSRYTSDPEVIGHMTAMARVTSLDGRGQVVADWVRLKPDHFFHACLGAGASVKTATGDVRIEDIRAGDMVWTRQGLRRVRAAGMTSPAAMVYDVRFSNGQGFIATSNHPVHTARGFVDVDALAYDDIITTWQDQKASPTGASSFVATRTVHAGRIGCTSRRTARTAKRESVASMRRSIAIIMARFRQDTSSITMMRTRSITSPGISSRFLEGTICDGTRRSGRARSTWLASDRSHMLGDGLRRVRLGTVSTPLSRASGSMNSAILPVRTAADPTLEPCGHRGTDHGIARMHARRWHDESPVSITKIDIARFAVAFSGSTGSVVPGHAGERAQDGSLVRLSGRKLVGLAPVYNLSVEGVEEYFANGILVHNSAYAAVARELTPRIMRTGRVHNATAKTQMPSGTNYVPTDNGRMS
jgi:hypothetical protein